ncbi:MAG: SGNH/GDSL hydrolase family protein [Rhodospirillaceae bacterium]|nr:SGNH/GDSL hydrolase family protein [Rhodospirillales bacterium]
MRRRRSKNRDEPNPVGTLFTNTAKLCLGAALVLVLAEWGGGLAMGKIRDNRAIATPSYTDQEIGSLYGTDNPQLYRDVLAEGARLGEAVYSPMVEYALSPQSGRYFTITADGYRGNGSSQDLAGPGAKVFVFGGSTTFGAAVADNETIPAYLDGVLKAAGKDSQVFNFGVSSWFSTQERIALERLLTSGRWPDVAVFVDGLSDFQACQVPDRSAWSDRLEQSTRVAVRPPLTTELLNRSNLLALGHWALGEQPAEAPDRAIACSSDADVDKVIRRLDTNRRIILAMADRLGFKAVFVQQPVPTYHYDNTKRPVPVKPGLLAHHMNSAKGYPRMAEMRAAGQLLDRNTLWLDELEPAEGNAYVDTVHYSPRFNRTLAEAIGRHILDNSLLP